MRAEKLLFADTLLRGPDYQEAQGTDWTLQTNAGEKVVKRVDRALRFADRAFAVAFPKARRPEDPRDVTILLFRDGRSLSEVAAFDNIIPRHTPIAGQYTPMDRMIYTAVGNDPLPLVVAVLVHEATHHLTYERLYPEKKRLPPWVTEGIATFIESLSRRDKYLNLRKIDRKVVKHGMVRWSPPGEVYLTRIREVAAAGALPSLESVLETELDGISTSLFYAYSWGVVHFLMNGNEGKYRQGFERWIMDPDLPTTGESFAATLGTTLPELDAELRAYLRTLR
jgi:hypothetical protein